MPARKLKPVEANDGSYAGKVLAAFDRAEAEAAKAFRLSWAKRELARLGWLASEEKRLRWKGEMMALGALSDAERRADAAWRARSNAMFHKAYPDEPSAGADPSDTPQTGERS